MSAGVQMHVNELLRKIKPQTYIDTIYRKLECQQIHVIGTRSGRRHCYIIMYTNKHSV